MDEEDSDDDSVVSGSKAGRKRKLFNGSVHVDIDIRRLSDAVVSVVETNQKPVKQFSIKHDWHAVALLYFKKSRIRKTQVSKLYNHYNRHLSGYDPDMLKSSSRPAEILTDPICSNPQEMWMSAVGTIVKNATAGAVESALQQTSKIMFGKYADSYRFAANQSFFDPDRPSAIHTNSIVENTVDHTVSAFERDLHRYENSDATSSVAELDSCAEDPSDPDGNVSISNFSNCFGEGGYNVDNDLEGSGAEQEGNSKVESVEPVATHASTNVYNSEACRKGDPSVPVASGTEFDLPDSSGTDARDTDNHGASGPVLDHTGSNDHKTRVSAYKDADNLGSSDPVNDQNDIDCRGSAKSKIGMFDEVGLSHETAEALAGCPLPKNRWIKKKLGGTTHKMKIPQEWKALPIVQCKGYRKYGGDFVNVCLSCVKKFNPICSFVVKSNYIKKTGSRKSSSMFFTGKGECHAPCSCKFVITLKTESDKCLTVRFTGDVCHDTTKPKARQIRGVNRKLEKEKYLQNSKLNPSEIYREKLNSLPPESYANGNRDGAGISKKTHQNIKAEAIAEINSFEVIHRELLALQKSFLDIDNKNTLKSGASFRKLFGYIQSFSVTHNQLRITLYHEKEIRLYHDICLKDIVFLDASGGMIQRIRNFDTVLLYSLGIRHPFGETFPLPTGMYFSSSHNVESVRNFIMTLRESEKLLYNGNNAQPRLIVSDNSKVLQNACLMEFNGESRLDYHNRTYKIVTGEATESDLKQTMLLSCHTHIIAQVKRSVSSYDNSKRHFCLRVVGRLINCFSLDEFTQIVKHMHLIMTTKYVDNDVEEAVTEVTDMINDWNVNDTDDESASDEEINEVDEDEEEDLGTSLWVQYWGNVLEMKTESKETSSDDPDAQDEKEAKNINKYFVPKFFAYFQKNMLNDAAFWSKICFSDLSRYGPRYKHFLEEPNYKGKNFRIKNSSNAPIENIFKFIKNDKSKIKVPLITFIKTVENKIDNLAKEYIDCVLRNLKENKDKDFTKRNIDSMKQWQNQLSGSSDISDDEYFPDLEKWSEKKNGIKRKAQHSSYLSQPAKVIHFKASKSKCPKVSKKEEAEQFKRFKTKNWKREAKHHVNVKSFEEGIKRKWQAMSASDKEKEAKALSCCDREDEFSCIISCMLCETQRHAKCIDDYDSELAFTEDRFVCEACVEANFRSLINCLYYSIRFSYTEAAIESALEKYNTMPLARAEALRCHKFLPHAATNLSTAVLIHSKQGVKNTNNNCWLSSLVHCLFGTLVYDVLIPAVNEETVSRLMKSLSMYISVASTADREVFTTLDQFSELCKFDLTKDSYLDPCEAFENFLSAINAGDIFSANLITVSKCGECDAINGATKSIGASVEIKLPGYLNSSPSVYSLLCNTLLGQCLKPSDGGDWCPKCRKQVGATTYSFFTKCPVVLALKVNRVDYDTGHGNLNTGKVQVTSDLHVQSLCPSFSDNDHTSYTLISTMNNEGGKSTYSNHFTSYLFNYDENVAVCFNDHKITQWSIEEILPLESYQKSVYMMFFIRNDVLCRSDYNVSKWFDIPIGRRLKIESRIFSENDDEYFRILHSVIGNNRLTGDAVTAFLARQAEMSRNLKVLTASSNLLKSVKKGFNDKEYNHFATIDIFSYDAILIPYHYISPAVPEGHWMLMVLYPSKKAMILLDSSNIPSIDPFTSCLHLLRQNQKQLGASFSSEDWTCIKPDIHKQSDETSCGVWCCINGFKVIHEDDITCTDQDISLARYWIVEKILELKSRKLFKREKKSLGEVSLPIKGPINVCKDVPGQRIGSIFTKLFAYRVRPGPTMLSTCDGKVPQRKTAQESRTKLALLIDSNQVEKDTKKNSKKGRPIKKNSTKETHGHDTVEPAQDEALRVDDDTQQVEEGSSGQMDRKNDPKTKRQRKRPPRKVIGKKIIKKEEEEQEEKGEREAEERQEGHKHKEQKEEETENEGLKENDKSKDQENMRSNDSGESEERKLNSREEIMQKKLQRQTTKSREEIKEEDRDPVNPISSISEDSCCQEKAGETEEGEKMKEKIENKAKAGEEKVQSDNVGGSEETKLDSRVKRVQKKIPRPAIKSSDVPKEENNEKDEEISSLNEDPYFQRLTHVGKCRTKTSQLIAYREFDRNTNPISDDPDYLSKLIDSIKIDGFLQSIHLGIDKENNTAQVTDGNHRLTCAANHPDIVPEYVKVVYHYGRYTDCKKLPAKPTWGSSFICGCDLGFTTFEV